MTKKDTIKIIEILKITYPDAKCSLDFTTPFELLVATVLSAQCTDDRVNKTTPTIFKVLSSPQDFANSDINVIEDLIRPCGFYKNKAKNIKEASKIIIEKFNGLVPNTMDELLILPGVGRKTANVVLLEAFNTPVGIAIDTHAKRISNNIGLSNNSDQDKIEQDLLKLIPHSYLKDVNHLFMWHGRNICIARKPKCDSCPINNYCKKFN